MSRYWFQPSYYLCDNCGRRSSAVGSRRTVDEPFPCEMCGFDAYPVWEDGDQGSKRNSHTGWNQPRSAKCDNCGTLYSMVGTRGEPVTCSLCYATVLPRHN